MLDITFIPKDNAKKTGFKPVTYHVMQRNNVIAASIASKVFKQEHKYKYYDKIVISETRVL